MQRRQEGCSTSVIAWKFEELLANPAADLDKRLERLLERLSGLKARKCFRYVEPSGLEEIRAERPDGPRHLPCVLSDDELGDRILGAWQGRVAGCLLGKLCEGWPREKIRDYLTRADAYPLNNYFPYVEFLAEEFDVNPVYRTAGTRGNICRMMWDDDTDYTILGLHILEKCGTDFTSEDVGATWLLSIPYHLTYTAERVAYRNLVEELKTPDTASYRNPYREWIGAQIRADAWGYAVPGLSELAAEFAFRDAAVSHVKNGIYGEMFFVVIVAGVLVSSSLGTAIEAGLAEIPARSRLAEAVHFVLKLRKRTDSWQTAHERIVERYGHYNRVHTINNAALVLLGLLWGEGDFERTITIAVMAGLDTDCNGATAGSVLGALVGSKSLPHEKWIAPLNDTIDSAVMGFDGSRISELAARFHRVALQTRSTHS